MSMKRQQQLLKLLIIGDCGVGKTNVLMRFCDDNFKMNYIATIGVDFRIKNVTVKGNSLKLQIWDTAGQERFKNIARTYYKGASGIVLTYSITDSRSFENIERWISQINEYAPKNVMRILIGNKFDLAVDREVQEPEGIALAHKYDMPFMEVSAKTGHNINQMFMSFAELLFENYLPTRVPDYSLYTLRSIQDEKTAKKCECWTK